MAGYRGVCGWLRGCVAGYMGCVGLAIGGDVWLAIGRCVQVLGFGSDLVDFFAFCSPCGEVCISGVHDPAFCAQKLVFCGDCRKS